MSTLADRVKEHSASTGTGAITLVGIALVGFRTFAIAFGASSRTVNYCIDDGAGRWEVGRGTFNGSTVLTRDAVLSSSNANDLVTFLAGTKTVYCTAPASLLDTANDYRAANFVAGTDYVAPSGNAATATTAINQAGGAANQIQFNTGFSISDFIAAPSVASTYLGWNGSAFVWSLTTGPTGATGATGAGGSVGATGATGATGVAGSPGSTGSAGTNGTNGSAATITVGTTTTGVAAVSNSGTANAAVLNFTVPQGSTGATGVAGATGSPGSNGTNGAQGIQGIQGTTGSTGTAGSAGATGATGGVGATGATGASGNPWGGGTFTGPIAIQGAITATGNITAYYSDDRLKTNLGLIKNALAKVKSLSGFYFEANATAQSLGYEVKREVGVSAQKVKLVMPEVVSPAPIDSKYLTVHYDKLIPLLIEAIKELSDKVDAI